MPYGESVIVRWYRAVLHFQSFKTHNEEIALLGLQNRCEPSIRMRLLRVLFNTVCFEGVIMLQNFLLLTANQQKRFCLLWSNFISHEAPTSQFNLDSYKNFKLDEENANFC